MARQIPARFEAVTSEVVSATDHFRETAKGFTGEEGAVYVTDELDILTRAIIGRHNLQWVWSGGLGEYETLKYRSEHAVQGAVQKCGKEECRLRINLLDVATGSADKLELECDPQTFGTEAEAVEYETRCAAARQETLEGLPDFLQGVNAGVARCQQTISRANATIAEANAELDRLI